MEVEISKPSIIEAIEMLIIPYYSTFDIVFSKNINHIDNCLLFTATKRLVIPEKYEIDFIIAYRFKNIENILNKLFV